MKLFYVIFLLTFSILLVNVSPVVAQISDNKLEIYRLQFAETELVLDTLKDIYGGDQNIRMTGVSGKLFIRASAKQHAEIVALIKELDVERKNVRIDVEFVGSGQKYDGGASLNPGGGVVYDSESGFHGRVTVKPSLYSRSSTTSSSSRQILMTMSGTHASLRIGERIPYLTWIMDYGYRYGIIASQVEWQDVGSFLSVEPTIIGDGPMIRVRLIPELSGLVAGQRRQIQFVQAQTEVIVRDGESVQIGGANKNSEFMSHFLVGFDKHNNSSKLDIILTPHIVGNMQIYNNMMMNDTPRRPKGW